MADNIFNKNVPNILSIAGSDPSGGAGVQADLKTIAALGGYGMAVITALTVQNTRGVNGVHHVPVEFVKAQLDSIFADIKVDAVKIGMLADEYIAHALCDVLQAYRPAHIILDPVMVSTSGDSLLSHEAVSIIKNRLAPLSSLVTPNIPEAGALLKASILDMDKAAADLASALKCPVLLKGGHLNGAQARDILCEGVGAGITSFTAKKIESANTHGTGCTLSSAIATCLAQGLDLPSAIDKSKRFVSAAIEASNQLNVGTGHGPLNHAKAGAVVAQEQK